MPVIDTETEEGKTELRKLIDAETEGLKAKNAELLGSQKKLKDEMKTIQDRLDEIAAEKEKAEEEASLKSGDVDKVRKQLEEKHKKEIEALTTRLGEKDTKLNKLLVDGALDAALAKSGIAPQYLDAVKALIKTSHKSEITEQDGDAIAVLDGKPIADFVSEWAQGDQGKHYLAAPVNGGGGANGTNGGGKATGELKRSKMSADEKAAYVTEHGQEKYLALPQ